MLRIFRASFSCYTGLSRLLYITTPIFYVNAKPHLGHIYSMLLADTRIRWEQLDPEKKTYFLTGTDEHGLKIQAVAEKEGVLPKELVDQVSQNFQNLAYAFNVRPDRFIRTTDPDHVKVVQLFWKLMEEKNLIYKSFHSGWYSVSDEAFYSEGQVHDIMDPKTGKKRKVSIESNSEVFFHDEENYFFKLSAFKDRLIGFLKSNPTFVYPPQKGSELLRLIEMEDLEDLSISRPSSRLSWGIDVPNDPSQKIYVWFDALINYLTAAGYPDLCHEESDCIWPALTHIVGKDIIRFHCVYWPAFLMAADLPLPKQVVVHSHWLSQGVKMSKSLGNVVDPMNLSQYYGADSTRLYLMEQANIAVDCRFSEDALYLSRAVLMNKWANICSRIQGGKFLLVRAVEKKRKGIFDNWEQLYEKHGLTNKEETTKILEALIKSADSLYTDMSAEMTRFGQMHAIQRWWELVELGNNLFSSAEPWNYATRASEEYLSYELRNAYEDIMDFVVYATAEVGRILSICIQPIMPQLSQRFLDHLDVDVGRRSMHYCRFGADLEYGEYVNKEKLMIKLKKRVL